MRETLTLAVSRLDTGSLKVKDSLKVGLLVFLATSDFFVFTALFCSIRHTFTYVSAGQRHIVVSLMSSVD